MRHYLPSSIIAQPINPADRLRRRLISNVRSYMETPSGIKQAVTAILATIAISTLLAVYQQITGNTSSWFFIFSLIIYAFLCILPYKISKKSNSARYVYLVITLVTLLSLFAIDYEKFRLEFVISLVLIPIEIFIIYRLFQKEASNWFLSK